METRKVSWSLCPGRNPNMCLKWTQCKEAAKDRFVINPQVWSSLSFLCLSHCLFHISAAQARDLEVILSTFSPPLLDRLSLSPNTVGLTFKLRFWTVSPVVHFHVVIIELVQATTASHLNWGGILRTGRFASAVASLPSVYHTTARMFFYKKYRSYRVTACLKSSKGATKSQPQLTSPSVPHHLALLRSVMSPSIVPIAPYAVATPASIPSQCQAPANPRHLALSTHFASSTLSWIVTRLDLPCNS